VIIDPVTVTEFNAYRVECTFTSDTNDNITVLIQRLSPSPVVTVFDYHNATTYTLHADWKVRDRGGGVLFVPRVRTEL